MADQPSFSLLAYSFRDSLTPDSNIRTTEFLQCAEHLVLLLDLLGKIAFKPVKADLTMNIKKTRDRQHAVPAESETLQELVRNERKTGSHTATEGLQWLTRGLDFLSQSFRHSLDNPSAELNTSLTAGYQNTLKPMHNFFIKPIFAAAMSAVPYRKDFYLKISPDADEATRHMTEAIGGLQEVMEILKPFIFGPEAKW